MPTSKGGGRFRRHFAVREDRERHSKADVGRTIAPAVDVPAALLRQRWGCRDASTSVFFSTCLPDCRLTWGVCGVAVRRADAAEDGGAESRGCAPKTRNERGAGMLKREASRRVKERSAPTESAAAPEEGGEAASGPSAVRDFCRGAGWCRPPKVCRSSSRCRSRDAFCGSARSA